MRQTRQKKTLRHLMMSAERPLSVREILEHAQKAVKHIGIATVYRHIGAWVDEGWLRPVEVPGSPIRYELAEKPHHHHFQCDRCGVLFEVEKCPERLNRMVPRGFRVRSHDITLYGTCAGCSRRAAG